MLSGVLASLIKEFKNGLKGKFKDYLLELKETPQGRQVVNLVNHLEEQGRPEREKAMPLT